MQAFDFTSLIIFLIVTIIFWVGILVVDQIFKLRTKGWEVQPGLLLAKTKRFNNFIDGVARYAPKVWKWIWNVGVIVGFLGIVLILMLLTWNMFNPFGGLATPTPAAESAVLPIVPGLTIRFDTFLWFLIPIIIIMVSHEMAHGIAARVDGITIRSSGIIVLLILFGAFVEPNEKQIEKKKPIKRMRVLAAGSFVNIIVGFFCLMLLSNSILFMAPFYSITPSGVVVQQVETTSPVYLQMVPGSVITAINDTKITSYEDLHEFMQTTNPFESITMTYFLFPPYTPIPSTTTIQLTQKAVDLGHNADSLDQGVASYQILQGETTSELGDLTKNGNYFNMTGNSTYNNASLLQCTIDFYELDIVPTSISLMELEINIFLNDTSNIGTASFQLKNSDQVSVEQATFNSTTTSNSIQQSFTAENVSNYISSNKIILIFDVRSSSEDYTLSIGYISINTTYSASYIGKIGIIAPNYYAPTGPLGFLVAPFGSLFQGFLLKTLLYTFMLAIGIGLFNLLPIPPFDGDKLFTTLVESVSGGKKKRVLKKSEDGKSEEEVLTWSLGQKITIWSVRAFAIFLLVSSIILTILFVFVFQTLDLSFLFP
ncbi:MAG: site-2 protease family protein [Candidatus Helarchaeota archaeon]